MTQGILTKNALLLKSYFLFHRTMQYFPVIRYEHDPGHPGDWQRVQVELVRHDATEGDECGTEADNQVMLSSH